MTALLDSDHLRTFIAIAETGSFTRAADLVHKTQSAVSMQMKRLEERIGRPIFERAGLTVLLSHQEVPLWYERGRKALVEWAGDHPVDRILLVDLTRLLMSAPHMRDRQELNPINQDNEVRPTWRVGLDGERIKDAPPADVEQMFPADLLDGAGTATSLLISVRSPHESYRTRFLPRLLSCIK